MIGSSKGGFAVAFLWIDPNDEILLAKNYRHGLFFGQVDRDSTIDSEGDGDEGVMGEVQLHQTISEALLLSEIYFLQ